MSDSGFSGVCLAFFLRPSEADQLAVIGGESPQDLHMTIAYFGDVDSWRPEPLCDFAGIVSQAAKTLPRLDDAKVAGYGRFTDVPDGEKTPVIALVDSPNLFSWRYQLLDMLRKQQKLPIVEHGFTPHITLNYIDKGAPMPLSSPPNISLCFDALTLAIAAKRYSYPLQLMDKPYDF